MSMKKKIVYECVTCGKKPLQKNEVGITLKLLGENTRVYYCRECLAEYLGVTIQDIEDKIEDFREQGCKLFE